jgi:uncharacterized protein with PIN domain
MGRRIVEHRVSGGGIMTEKPRLEESTQPPACPHCKTSLRTVRWHKVKGEPGMMSYFVLVSCPHCKAMLGTAAS